MPGAEAKQSLQRTEVTNYWIGRRVNPTERKAVALKIKVICKSSRDLDLRCLPMPSCQLVFVQILQYPYVSFINKFIFSKKKF